MPGVALVGFELVSSTFEISLFYGFAFVVFFLTFTGGDDELNIAAAAEKFHGYELVAVLFCAGKLGELAFRDEELDIARSVGAEG